MASRPFASVAVALDVGGDREELLQVRIQHKHATISTDSKATFKEENCEQKREISLLYGSKDRLHW